jgi:hypothetical protein
MRIASLPRKVPWYGSPRFTAKFGPETALSKPRPFLAVEADMESTPPTPQEPPAPSGAPLPELAELPPPRRPWRRATLVTLASGAVASTLFAAVMLPDARYSLRGGAARDLGELTRLVPGPELADTWVRAEGQLSVTNAIRYRRPLERDSYRLASVAENPRVWVQVRVPEGEEDPRFVPPDSFVGRLIPVSQLGIRQRGLADAVGAAGLSRLGGDAWLLVDGESPAALRWVLGLLALLLSFAAFNVIGLVRLLRPIPSTGGTAP